MHNKTESVPSTAAEQTNAVSPQTLITLKEARFPLYSLILVVLAFCLTAYMAYLNYEVSKVAGAQLVRAQQLQEHTQTKFMDQYSRFLLERDRAERFDRSFEVRQQYYSGFMAALSDTWSSVGRKNQADLDQSLNALAKSYYGLEPFLERGSRLYLQKRIKIFHNLARQLIGYESDRPGIIMEDKTTMDRMIGDFQQFLYPLLFEPERAEGESSESGKTDR